MAKKRDQIFVNCDLKRENGRFDKVDTKGLLKLIRLMYKQRKKRQRLVIYMEFRNRKDFEKVTASSMYEIKESKRSS